MTYEEAIEFFAKYGNVSRKSDGLRKIPPQEWQLKEAVTYAVVVFGQPAEVAEDAVQAIRLATASKDQP